MTKKLFALSCVLLGGSVIFCAEARAEDAASGQTAAPSLESELKKVQADLQFAQTNLTVRTSELWQSQHDLEYGDPDLKQLRESLVALEKQVLEKRKEIQVRLAAKPEYKALEAQRKDLFRRVEELRLKEEVIRREISSAQYASPAQNQGAAP